MNLNIVVVYGSVRENRQGIKGVRFIVSELKKRNHEVTLVDPLEYNLPLLEKMYKQYEKGKAPENLQKLYDIFNKCDAVVVVSAEYNHIIPPALSNLMAHFSGLEYRFKSSAIVSYATGSFGGVRAAMQLRIFLSELGMPSIPHIFPIPRVHEFSEDGEPYEKRYFDRAEKFIAELEWYAEALKSAREKGTPY